MRGANCTGRPFTGDFAGDLLYATLQTFGFAQGDYGGQVNDGLKLIGCRITNAVRCVPPENKPVAVEVNTCRQFLIGEIESQANLRIILALGTLAHNAVLRALGYKQSTAKFSHNARHALSDGLTLADSYHCSRLNTNTGRLTTDMFREVIADLSRRLDAP